MGWSSSLQDYRIHLTMIRVSFILFFAITLSSGYGQVARDLEIKEFKHLMDSIPGAVVIDLRTPDELKDGMIPNAIHLDYFAKDFENRIGNLDPAKTYFLYCASGGRSGQTIELMGKRGFRQVFNLQGGFTAWKKGRMPIVAAPRR